jgi:hypothetical protein
MVGGTGTAGLSGAGSSLFFAQEKKSIERENRIVFIGRVFI